MKYRSDIDGLRAIAVLSVVIYHLNIGLLPGGFVGVDIFFVISGYLISKIIYSEVESGSFSIANFYVRRARRILPAFLSVIIATSIAAYCLLYPS
jgi:peptidoglycan/LPS O-acetylase OafA/YrhL